MDTQTPKTFSIRSSYRISGDPQIIGEELANICQQHNGELTPAAVVDNARDITSPLHDCFCWDDTEAARLHRENQARYLIRSITVKYIKPEGDTATIKECRAFISHVAEDNQKENDATTTAHITTTIQRSYVPVDTLRTNDNMRAYAIGELRRQANAMIRTAREMQDYLDYLTDDVVDKLNELEAILI